MGETRLGNVDEANSTMSEGRFKYVERRRTKKGWKVRKKELPISNTHNEHNLRVGESRLIYVDELLISEVIRTA